MNDCIHGNLDGLRDASVRELEALLEETAGPDEFLPRGLMRRLSALSSAFNREIAVCLTRDGEIIDVAVGTDADVELRDCRLRRSRGRLSRVRLIHTHPNGDGRLSDVDLSALRLFRYDAMAAVGCRGGEPTWVQAAFLGEGDSLILPDPVRWHSVPDAEWLDRIAESDRVVGRETGEDVADKPERAVLMGIDSEESLAELARLAETAGAEVVGAFLQKRQKPDSGLFIGSGRADELARDCQALEADMCVFDEELSGIQARNLEAILGVKVIDRTTLILDIFARRAASAEGKLQVELAQLQYRSARLIGAAGSLSRLAGGIGTRGPGESKLEVDRRRIRERITELRRRLDEVERQRVVRRRNRERSGIPTVALVGYTNAGKSTLLNRLTGADVFVEDRLFATLDAVSRRTETSEKTPYLLVDTVGFIRKLPHTLVSAFRSTLEEASGADVLVLVSDGASSEAAAQHDTVEAVLAELGATDQPRVECVNKADLGEDLRVPPVPGILRVSARTGEGLDDLNAAIAEALQKTTVTVSVFFPYARGGDLQRVRAMGRVLDERYTDEGTVLTLVLPAADRDRIAARWGTEVFVNERSGELANERSD
ncbi:MAG: GTPase HflX [Clostridia bacterium]|nr:GTPase HflX [Clostridia bacterium]